jgi:hypothetical protein
MSPSARALKEPSTPAAANIVAAIAAGGCACYTPAVAPSSLIIQKLHILDCDLGQIDEKSSACSHGSSTSWSAALSSLRETILESEILDRNRALCQKKTGIISPTIDGDAISVDSQVVLRVEIQEG